MEASASGAGRRLIWIGFLTVATLLATGVFACAIPFAALAALAAALDLNFVLRRRLSARQRIGRHLWRMCAALLIAAFSFFLGQQKVMPEAIQGSPWLFVPALAPLVLMIFWLVRARFSRVLGGRPRPEPERVPQAAHA